MISDFKEIVSNLKNEINQKLKEIAKVKFSPHTMSMSDLDSSWVDNRCRDTESFHSNTDGPDSGRQYDYNESEKVSDVRQNKQDGCAREEQVQKELETQYPEAEGYEIIREAYLRDENGNIVKDPETGSARRIDFVVVKDGKVVDSVEVTSKTADKTDQTAKETRIRENGGNYVRDKEGNLCEMNSDTHTRIERRD